ncbi:MULTISPECIES: tsukubadiene synthase [Streptomyces]|uniref:Tsukubadiene synthase n=2 Tax=Streptomyces tsukubensis (strain DSM 42081 / NBRC 108919 / NRRL 18488 / 9993) TaxID=1114943 RepID=TSUKU_STRT9|nr:MULTISPECIES: terpene synthase family protein [Streptomyces]I2N045.1 RecName: Full=Tsukubadiene synthase; Short=TdS [Streptomyces tsukubensis NRRL18488]AZK94629.1 hypothetical protein B7R87_12705 [Streptomyces tsukubensis]EIF90392.1 glutamate dehydrogenase/leucine dehydrogenase [Streptomyces tsukubensis NRRL18488]MYS65554.1 hypothetical protein [Streptomyces sp. SID5473]QKM69287.1 hypothetical protein STSU_021060 [Streptomyces tsukubensis NRRL18488]TAI42781.1 hypothetical protein EWI31_204
MIEVPPFWCPLPIAIHPAADQAEKDARAWAERYGVRLRIADQVQPGRLGAYWAPHGTYEGMLAVGCWNFWAFAFDDHLDEPLPLDVPVTTSLVQQAVDIPSPPITDDPWAAGAQAVFNMFRDLATPTQVRYCADNHRRWLHGACWRHSNHVNRRLPPLAEYIPLRMQDAAAQATCLIAVLIGSDISVPEQEMDSPRVRALLETASWTATIDSDLHSFQLEDTQRPVSQHIVSVLMHERGIGVDEALRQSVALRDRFMTRFLHLQQECARTGSSELARFAHTLGYVISGYLQWAVDTSRYGQTEATFSFTDTPRDDTPEPPPGIPSVEWLWTL